MRPHRRDFAVEGGGDVDVVVDLAGRAVEQPRLGHRPGAEARGGQVGQCERVARVGVDGGQRGGAGGEVVGVAAAEPLPVPLRAPRHHPLGADLADDLDEGLVQATAGRAQVAFGQAEEPHAGDAQEGGGGALFGAADGGNVGAGDVRVVAAGVAVGQDDRAIVPPAQNSASSGCATMTNARSTSWSGNAGTAHPFFQSCSAYPAGFAHAADATLAVAPGADGAGVAFLIPARCPLRVGEQIVANGGQRRLTCQPPLCSEHTRARS